MKRSFKFDKRTGTMVATGDEGEVVSTPSTPAAIPSDANYKEVVSQAASGSSQGKGVGDVLKMKKVDVSTPVLLIGEDGLPISYLDAATEGILMFRETQDYDICQISDERTGKVLGYIGGYALQIKFNLDELNSPERVEQCLEGLTKLFRHKITQMLADTKSSK